MLRPLFILYFTIVTLFASWVHAKPADQGCTLQLMPCPQNITLITGQHHFEKQVNIYFEGMSGARQTQALQRLTEQLERLENFDFGQLNLQQNKDQANLIIQVKDQSAGTDTARFPRLGDDESYQLSITPSTVAIQSISDFGALHGITTLTQLLYAADEKNAHLGGLTRLVLPTLKIEDRPKFKWRGLLIDSVRHFIPLTAIKRQLDGMAGAKLNVFHWHLNDDQGWRIESKRYPKLHQMASDNLYYTQAEIKQVVDYASLLGIRVVPELDIPGHASSIAVAYPKLMAEKKSYVMQRHWGVFEPVLDVSDAKVYQFIDDLVAEFSLLFPDNYIHIGGDEVNHTQWLNNPAIQALMNNEGLTDSEDLHHYFNLKVQAILAKYQRKMMGWDEIYHPDLPNDIVIQSWRGLESMNRFANSGYQGVLSTGFYIDQPQYSAYHYRNHPIANLDKHNHATHDLGLPKLGPEAEGQYRSWKLTIPRLKGSAVTGTLITFSQNSEGKAADLTGYLKLNNNAFKKVTILTHLEELNSRKLVFSVDSWMGPLRFELDLALAKSTLALSKLPNKNRVFIGNAFYPLEAKVLSLSAKQEIYMAPPLKADNAKNILGGEATLWAELVTQHNIDLRVWPRLFVIAERLWSSEHVTHVDNMYQRLSNLDKFAEKILGLQHNKQLRQGLSNLLENNGTQQNITALLQLTQLVEPAHYYTRHHLKYQQDKYHQLAPLEDFVDFLPVESVELINLNKLIVAYQNGDESVFPKIKLKVKNWQQNDKQLTKFIHTDSKLASLIPLVTDVAAFNRIAENILNICMATNEKPFKDSVFSELNKQLAQLQEQQNETVIAGIVPFQRLIKHCQVMNQ